MTLITRNLDDAREYMHTRVEKKQETVVMYHKPVSVHGSGSDWTITAYEYVVTGIDSDCPTGYKIKEILSPDRSLIYDNPTHETVKVNTNTYTAPNDLLTGAVKSKC